MIVRLKVNGRAFEGFESGEISLTMEHFFNDFAFEYVTQGPSQNVRQIFRGDEVTLELAGNEVLSGYIVATDTEDAGESIRFRVIGRSRTIDLECSVVDPPFVWKSQTIDRIALDLCRPLGIDVHVLGSTGLPFDSFSVLRGDTVYDALSKLALRRGKVLYCVGGDLVISSVGSFRTATVLERGSLPLIESGVYESWEERFSDYVFCAQAAGKDNRWGKAAAQIKHAVNDPSITRYRPTLVTSEADDESDLRTRATLERNQRAGRSERVTCVAHEWTTREGYAWRPNMLVRFKNPVLGVDADLLVASVRFRLGAYEKRETDLVLCRPEAFDVVEYPKKNGDDAWK